MLNKKTNIIVFRLIVSMQSRSNSTIWFSGFYTQTNYTNYIRHLRVILMNGTNYCPSVIDVTNWPV